MIPDDRHVRDARYVSHYDGDSITVDIDLWKNLQYTMQSRLLGIDTPERYGPTALERQAARYAQQFVGDWMAYANTSTDSWPLVIRSVKITKARAETGDYGKYGRLLLRVWRKIDGTELNQALLDQGLGRIYWGGERLAWTVAQLESMSPWS